MHEDNIQSNRENDVKQIFVQTKSWMVHIIIVDPRWQNIIVGKCEEEQTVWEENRAGGRSSDKKSSSGNVLTMICVDT